MIQSGSDMCARLYELARTHNGKNVWDNFAGVPIFIIQRHEDADRVLRLNSQNYLKNMRWFRQAIGRSRFSEDGADWEVRRDLTQPFFSRFDRERTCALACRHARQALAQLVQDSQDGQDHIDDLKLRRMAIAVLVENFFGVPLEQTPIDVARLGQLMEHSAKLVMVPAGKSREASKEVQHKLTELRRQTLADLAPFRQGAVPSSPLLDALLQADREGKIVLEHELLSIFSAGADTTAATVSWLCYLLARYPEKQQALRQWCMPSAQATDWETLSQITMIGAWIAEALRLYPSSPILDRLAIHDDYIGGQAIEAGQNVLVSLIGVLHDAQLRPDPWELHLGDTACPAQNRKNSGIHSAFSFGPRVCGGKHFALVELTGFLHTFVTRAHFALTSSSPPAFAWKTLLWRQGGQPVQVTPCEAPLQ